MAFIKKALKLGFCVLIFATLGHVHFAVADTTINGAISVDTTWGSSGNPYIISNAWVNSGVTLTIDPGVIVKFQDASSFLHVDGTLVVNGTDTERVYFTSIKDDTVGGDTNLDGSATTPASQDWQSIKFNTGSAGTLQYSTIRYAGSTNFFTGIHNNGGDISISNSIVTDNGNSGVLNMSGSLNIDYSEISNSNMGVVIFLGDADISDSLIKNNSYGVYAQNTSSTNLTLTNNIFTDNIEVAVSVHAQAGFIHSNNVATGSKISAFLVSAAITGEVTWTKDIMPYVIEGGAISASGILNLDPGVVVKFKEALWLDIDGSLNANGTPTDKVYFTSIKDDSVGGDTNGDGNATSAAPRDWRNLKFNGGVSNLSNVVLTYAGYPNFWGHVGIYVTGADLTVSDSVIADNGGQGIFASGGTATINNSQIINHDYGMHSGGGLINITGSSIKNNSQGAAINNSSQVINAVNNYWGDPSGPYHPTLNVSGLGDSVSDKVDFAPWLGSDPFGPTPPPACTVDCYSSVLFLPGVKGSVLKNGSDTLWPPTVFSINDTSQLALNTDGTSVNDIYTDGIMNNFLGTPIYEPFTDFMDSMSGPGKTINEWLPLGYDWRFSPEENIANGIKTPDGVVDIINKVEELATASKSGKVTIIAHSMGGLLGKAIIKKLEEEGKDGLIDSFVMVGTPQLGTPQAIAALLHGTGEGVVAGFIVNGIEMRAIGQNMSSAYDLLPSQDYFHSVPDPVIKFDPSTQFTTPWINLWDKTIDNYGEFSDFITGQGVARSKPTKEDLHIPEVLRSDIFARSENFHNEYDNYNIPDHVRVVQIAGWGIPTAKAVEYTTNHGYQSYKIIPTREGDKTVVYQSAISSNGDETYYFNIFNYNDFSGSDAQHRDLLSSQPIQEALVSVMQNKNMQQINFISDIKPEVDSLEDQMIVSSFSPVVLGAYDSLGNFTGIEQNQDLSADILSIKEEIPGSTFMYTGEQQSIFLPKGGVYSFVYKGVGNGPTTVTVENFEKDVVAPVVAFTDMPTSATTDALFDVNTLTPENTIVNLDNDGDGQTDQVVVPDNTEKSLNELMASLKSKINSLNIKDKIKQNLLKRVESLEKKILAKKAKNVKILDKFTKQVLKQVTKGKLSQADAASISELLSALEARSDDVILDAGILGELKNRIQTLNIKQNLKNEMLKRVVVLEQKQGLIKKLQNIENNINKKATKGKMDDAEAQALIDLLTQIEAVL